MRPYGVTSFLMVNDPSSAKMYSATCVKPADFAPCTSTTARTPPGIAVSERVW